MWVSCPTCRIFAHIPNNKNRNEKWFAFPTCLVKWTYLPVSLHLSVLSPSSLSQPSSSAIPLVALLSHMLTHRATDLTICPPHAIHSSHGQEISEEEDVITSLCSSESFEKSLAKTIVFHFPSVNPPLPTSLNPFPTTSN